MPQMTRLLRSMNLFESSPHQMNNYPEKELTLKGKKNHYNVKLLRGYGVSINLKDNKVILKNCQDYITGKSEKENLPNLSEYLVFFY